MCFAFIRILYALNCDYASTLNSNILLRKYFFFFLKAKFSLSFSFWRFWYVDLYCNFRFSRVILKRTIYYVAWRIMLTTDNDEEDKRRRNEQRVHSHATSTNEKKVKVQSSRIAFGLRWIVIVIVSWQQTHNTSIVVI